MRDSAAAMPMTIAKKALAGCLEAAPVNGTIPLLYGDRGLVELPMVVRPEVDVPVPELPNDEPDELPIELPEPLVLPEFEELPDTELLMGPEDIDPADAGLPEFPGVDEPPETIELPELPTPEDEEGS